jgi:hypothetical protein
MLTVGEPTTMVTTATTNARSGRERSHQIATIPARSAATGRRLATLAGTPTRPAIPARLNGRAPPAAVVPTIDRNSRWASNPAPRMLTPRSASPVTIAQRSAVQRRVVSNHQPRSAGVSLSAVSAAASIPPARSSRSAVARQVRISPKSTNPFRLATLSS